jgi:hypothetical protein
MELHSPCAFLQAAPALPAETQIANCRILTSPCAPRHRRNQLPGFDVSKTEGGIQKTGNRGEAKARRQKPAVGFAGQAHHEGTAQREGEASKTGSSEMPGFPRD